MKKYSHLKMITLILMSLFLLIACTPQTPPAVEPTLPPATETAPSAAEPTPTMIPTPPSQQPPNLPQHLRALR
ncbi:MAG TPA: hypothetical protein PK530_12615, partial [Anaerolineales bacterium]|nr:hypothetical protein [Anaerolineales bacterium]